MATLALSMIVRNGGEDLRRCLESVRGLADQMVVADTGSTDETARIARECGAQVMQIAWENDFARARNLSLSEVRTDWVLVLDADEMLDTGAQASIPRLLKTREFSGYQVTIRN
jgi:glycosyltransferase involved in cell wall biosynthesis